MKRRTRRTILTSFLSVVITLLVVSVILYIYTLKQNEAASTEPEVTYTQEQLDKAKEDAFNSGKIDLLNTIKMALQNGDSVISVLKKLYPEYLVVASQGVYHWVDIDDSLVKNNYTLDNLQCDEETGEYTYYVDGQLVSKKGIDVSSHQGTIDWEKVAADGVEFAFIRAYYRGYGSGKLVEDEMCMKNVNAAKASGIKVGVYVFSQAITPEEAVEEAEATLELLDGTQLDLPIVYDVERVASSDARMNVLSSDERTNVALAFLNRIEESGYKPMVYHNTEMGALLLDMSRLTQYDKWFAGYNKEFYWPYSFNVWQYTEHGTVDGIKGEVDLDLWITDVAQ